jgi:predicted transcriptional regulator
MAPRAEIPPPLHELEAEVMDGVWDANAPEVTVREVMEALNARAAAPRAYTTYMTIMRRLDEKGVLSRRREGKTDLYRPVHSREEYADLRAQAGVDQLVADYGELALGHFARQMAQLDPDRRRQLQRLAREK